MGILEHNELWVSERMGDRDVAGVDLDCEQRICNIPPILSISWSMMPFENKGGRGPDHFLYVVPIRLKRALLSGSVS